MPLVAVYAAVVVHIVVQALRFQFEAARARDRLLEELDTLRHEVVGNEEQLGRLRMVREEIEGLRRGAFVPWTRHPILQSIGLSGGIGFITWMELFLF